MAIKKRMFVFGNDYLRFDSFAREVAHELQNIIEIVFSNTPEDLIEVESNEILILDVVKNIDKPIVITDIAQLKTNNLTSLHDLDVAYVLTLMKELGINKKVLIVGVPESGDLKIVSGQVRRIIQGWST